MKIVVSPKGKPYIMIGKGIHPIYAEKNGGLVLKTEVHWRKISGFSINTNRGCYWIYFRRYYR